MRISWTFSYYLMRRFSAHLAGVFGGFAVLLFLASLATLIRRTASKGDIPLANVVEMAFLQMPNLINVALPFIFLIAAMSAFAALSRHSELVVARAGGVSAWQFLAPALLLTFILGTLIVTAYNPIAAAITARFEEREARYIKGRTSLIAVSESGLWLRQGEADKSQSVVHALRVSENGARLHEAVIFIYDTEDRLLSRFDAEEVHLGNQAFEMRRVWYTKPDQPSVFAETMRLPTSLTPGRVRTSSAPPETIAFWNFPRFIRVAERAGFSAARYRAYFYELIALPIFLAAMTLLGAAFCLLHMRHGQARTAFMVASGLMSGFGIYAMIYFARAVGFAGIAPAFITASVPVILTASVGLTLLFYREEG